MATELENYNPSDDLDRMQRELMQKDELIELLETYLAGASVLARFLKRSQERHRSVLQAAITEEVVNA